MPAHLELPACLSVYLRAYLPALTTLKMHLLAAFAARSLATFAYQDVFAPAKAVDVPYRLITRDGIRTEQLGGRTILHVAPETLTALTSQVRRLLTAQRGTLAVQVVGSRHCKS